MPFPNEDNYFQELSLANHRRQAGRQAGPNLVVLKDAARLCEPGQKKKHRKSSLI
jgi:hypothetical protein